MREGADEGEVRGHLEVGVAVERVRDGGGGDQRSQLGTRVKAEVLDKFKFHDKNDAVRLKTRLLIMKIEKK